MKLILYFSTPLLDYTIAGRKDVVKALEDIRLAPGNEFYPIRRSEILFLSQPRTLLLVANAFNFNHSRGEFVMLRGPSGGGKTSLLNILGTIDRASGGRVGTRAAYFFGTFD